MQFDSRSGVHLDRAEDPDAARGLIAELDPGEPRGVRPYARVADVQAALDAALAVGATLVHPAHPLDGLCTFALYETGGQLHGLWRAVDVA